MTNLQFVEATRNDVPLILEFIRELASFERLEHTVTADSQLLIENMFPTSGRPFAHAVFVMSDGQPAAMALYFFNFSTFTGCPGLYLEDLYVREKYRGNGIGTRIFSHLARKAIEMKCARFEWAVLDWNVQARDFYKKMGAQEGTQWILNRLDGRELEALAHGNSQV